jgi:hypothetical protein
MSEMAAIPQPRPYRWGKFQGWALVLLGIIPILTMLSLLYWADNAFAVGFFEGYDRRLLNVLQQAAITHNYAEFVGYAIGSLTIPVPLGVLILKKRMSLFFLIAASILKALLLASIPGLVYWIVCTVYYAKRRTELRWP